MSALLAAIDVGSNAVRLFIARASREDGKIEIRKQNFFRIPLRLGKDVYHNGVISPERAEMFIETMVAFKHLVGIYKPDKLKACATAAIREAENGMEILERAEQKTGLKINVIDGLEEARLIRNTASIKDNRSYELTMFMDVGGGSTEISVLSANQLLGQESFKIGTLRMLSDKVTKGHWLELNQWLGQYADAFGKINLVGSGGNINKLVKLFGRPNENLLIYNNLKYAYTHLKAMPVSERMSVFNLREDRADVIVPASEIFLNVMERIKADHVLAPKIGVADGLIYEMYEQLSFD